MGFLETVEGIRSSSVLGLIWMYEERLLAVSLYNIGFGYTRLKIEDIVSIVLEGFEDSCRKCQPSVTNFDPFPGKIVSLITTLSTSSYVGRHYCHFHQSISAPLPRCSLSSCSFVGSILFK